MQIIKEAERVTVIEKCLDIYNEKDELCMGFPVKDTPDSECRNIKLSENEYITIRPAAEENYQFAMQKISDNLWSKHINKHESSYKENAVGLCSCGEKVELFDQYLGACECPNCGQWYNLFGQELTNPSKWSEYEDF